MTTGSPVYFDSLTSKFLYGSDVQIPQVDVSADSGTLSENTAWSDIPSKSVTGLNTQANALQQRTNWIRANQPVVVTNVSALRALDKTKIGYAITKGYYTAGDGGAGEYWYDSSDTTSTDNGGSVIVGSDGGRWKIRKQGVISVKLFGAVCDGVADDSVRVLAANNYAYSNALLLSFPSATLISTATNITAGIEDSLSQLFTVGSSVTLSGNAYLRPEWFGSAAGSISRAIAALPATGGVIHLQPVNYNMIGIYTLDTKPVAAGGTFVGNTKQNVTLLGSGMPALSSDESSFITGSGTVIQGAVINFANGFECRNLGVDVGASVVALNGGVHMEGFVPGTHKLDTTWNDYTTYIKDVYFENIRVLAKQPTAGDHTTEKHCCLIEHIDGGSHGFVECIGGTHGYVMKSRNFHRNGMVRAWRQYTSAAIFKTDSYAECYNSHGGDISIGKYGHSIRTGRVQFQAAPGTKLKSISFGYCGVNCTGLARVYDGSTTPMEDVTITSVLVDDVNETAVTIPSVAVGWSILSHRISVCPIGISTEAGCVQCSIGSGSVSSSTGDGYYLAGDISHGNLSANACGGWGIYNNGAVIDPTKLRGIGNTNGLFSGVLSVTSQITSSTSWTGLRASFYGNTVYLYAQAMKGSATAEAGYQVAAGFRPTIAKTFSCAAYTGSAWTTIPVAVSTSGVITFVGTSSFTSSGFVCLDSIRWSII